MKMMLKSKLSVWIALTVISCAAFADTAIPSGKAVYDVTLNFTDYPELYEFGAWPVRLDLGLGQPFDGERVAVSTNIVDNVTNISLTVRAAWDIQGMIDYSKLSTYEKAQAKICTRARAGDSSTYWYSDTANGGYWTGRLAKYEFTDVTTIEGFMSTVAEYFLDSVSRRTMTKPGAPKESSNVLLNSLSIKLVRTLDSTVCTAGTPVVCKLRIRFNRPISVMGYESVTSFQLENAPSAGTVFDFAVAQANLSSDGCEISGLVSADVGSIVTLINSEDYKSNSNYKGATTLYLNGSSTRFAAGSTTWLASADGMTVADLSKVIKDSIMYRDYSATAQCRIVAIDLEPKTKNGGLFLMRW